jgi:hypothetical protein
LHRKKDEVSVSRRQQGRPINATLLKYKFLDERGHVV